MICALVLAAGRSQRMGKQKLLLPLGGKPAIAHVVDTLLRSPVGHIQVIVGQDAAQIRSALSGRKIDYTSAKGSENMLDSVRAGLRTLPTGCTGILVALGDQPLLRVRLIKRMIAALQNTGHGIIVPTHLGQGGHPLLFSGRYRREVLTRHEETGLRGLRLAHPNDVFALKTAAASVLEDMDTPTDYRRHLARWAAHTKDAKAAN